MKSNFQKFKLAAEYAPIHIIFTDLDGKILYANKAVGDVTGYERSEIIGNNPRLWGRQMPPEFYKKLWKTIKKDKKVFSGEIKNKRKKGDKIEIEDDKFYILCELKENILYVINVKRK